MQTKWNILQSYTCHIRTILVQDFHTELDEKSIIILLNPPSPITVPLFPNLHTLLCKYTEKNMHLLHLPLSSLVLLDVEFKSPHLFQNSLKLFPKFSLNIKSLSFGVHHLEAMFKFSKIEPNYIRHWKNLCSVTLACPQVTLDMEALLLLSCMPTLTQLTFALNAALPTSNTPLFFTGLHEMTLYSESLHWVSWFLSQTQLLAITNFTAFIQSYPSR